MTSTTFRLRSHMVIEGDASEDDQILIDGHTGAMCACNPAASLLLERLREGASRDQLADALARRFTISDEAARRDARHFLDSLSALAAIEVVDAQADPAAQSAPGRWAYSSA